MIMMLITIISPPPPPASAAAATPGRYSRIAGFQPRSRGSTAKQGGPCNSRPLPGHSQATHRQFRDRSWILCSARLPSPRPLPGNATFRSQAADERSQGGAEESSRASTDRTSWPEPSAYFHPSQAATSAPRALPGRLQALTIAIKLDTSAI